MTFPVSGDHRLTGSSCGLVGGAACPHGLCTGCLHHGLAFWGRGPLTALGLHPSPRSTTLLSPRVLQSVTHSAGILFLMNELASAFWQTTKKMSCLSVASTLQAQPPSTSRGSGLCGVTLVMGPGAPGERAALDWHEAQSPASHVRRAG